MAVVEKTISAQIYAFMKASSLKKQDDSDKAMKDFSDNLAKVIATAIKTATVNPGIPVSTAGTAVAQTGATTGPGTLS
jgi:hypothetical protein